MWFWSPFWWRSREDWQLCTELRKGRTARVRSGIAWQHHAHVNIFRMPVGDVSEDPSVSAELRPWVKLRSQIVTLWGTRWRARAAANESPGSSCTGSMWVSSTCVAWLDLPVMIVRFHTFLEWLLHHFVSSPMYSKWFMCNKDSESPLLLSRCVPLAVKGLNRGSFRATE